MVSLPYYGPPGGPHGFGANCMTNEATLKVVFERVRTALFQPIAGHSLALFRILFGTIMLFEVVSSLLNGKIRYCYVEPTFYFPYLCAPFVTPLPAPSMYTVCVVMAASAAFMAAGLCFRASALLFTVLYTYVFLIDKTMYNNHFYLMCLLSLLLAISSAGKCWSLDNLIRSSDNCRVPRWNLSILRFQIALVLFYGAKKKFNKCGVLGEPMRTWLQERSHYPLVGPYWNTEFGAMFFTYGGLLFDLLTPFFLISGTMLWLIVPLFVFFNLMNSWLFTIGSFPPLMLAALLLFVPP